jgi:hypothetical protein
MLCSSG